MLIKKSQDKSYSLSNEFIDIYAVVVLYKTTLADSETIKSLGNSFSSPIALLVFDNSPQRQYESDYFVFNNFNIEYHHDGTNPGLSAAYNLALKKGVALNKKWLLLLDQDTFFTKNYVDEIISTDYSKIPNSVVAIIPKVLSLKDNKTIAPAKMLTGGLCKVIEINSGISISPITGINSGTLINIQFINSIHGFNKAFPLDMLDHWYFREIYKSKKKVLVLKSIIYQNLSVSGDYEAKVTIERYKNMLIAEKLFVKNDGFLGVFIFKLRLIWRAFKQLNFKNKMYFRTSISVFLNYKQILNE